MYTLRGIILVLLQYTLYIFIEILSTMEYNKMYTLFYTYFSKSQQIYKILEL
jgi:hypothetical protein